jgi:hypothetical protein
MKIKELIEKLNRFNPDLSVIVGVDGNIGECEGVQFDEDCNTVCVYGK